MISYKNNDFISDENSTISFSIMSVLGDRNEQQDCFGYSLKDGECLFTICDGMGGYEYGKLASSFAVKSIISSYENSNYIDDAISFLRETTVNANNQISEMLNKNNENSISGSTLVSIMIKGYSLFWNSVGDSRAYLLRDRAFVQITQDHNYKTVLDGKLKIGAISKKDYINELVDGEKLICHLGMENLNLIDYNDSSFALKSNDRVVIMTDGLYKILSDKEIFNIFYNFYNTSDALKAIELKVKKTVKKLNKLRDNMTVCIVKIK